MDVEISNFDVSYMRLVEAVQEALRPDGHRYDCPASEEVPHGWLSRGRRIAACETLQWVLMNAKRSKPADAWRATS